MRNLEIRQTTGKDHSEIYNVIKAAFETAERTDGDEQDYAAKLREEDNYIPGLDLIAIADDKIIGQIMFTKTYVSLENSEKAEGLLLSPISVLLEYRNLGIGSALIREGFIKAREMGHKSVFLCGDPAYYHRFGFKPTVAYNIRHISGLPEENVMVCELEENALKGISGTVDIC